MQPLDEEEYFGVRRQHEGEDQEQLGGRPGPADLIGPEEDRAFKHHPVSLVAEPEDRVGLKLEHRLLIAPDCHGVASG